MNFGSFQVSSNVFVMLPLTGGPTTDITSVQRSEKDKRIVHHLVARINLTSSLSVYS